MTDKISFKTDETHKWGTYRELKLTDDWMSRIIRFYVGGMTSVHKHPVDEIVIVEMGLVKCLSGTNPKDLTEKIYGPGQQMYLPAGVWHSCGAVEGISKDITYALGIEYIWGKIENGNYRIERYKPSTPSPFKK